MTLDIWGLLWQIHCQTLRDTEIENKQKKLNCYLCPAEEVYLNYLGIFRPEFFLLVDLQTLLL